MKTSRDHPVGGGACLRARQIGTLLPWIVTAHLLHTLTLIAQSHDPVAIALAGSTTARSFPAHEMMPARSADSTAPRSIRLGTTTGQFGQAGGATLLTPLGDRTTLIGHMRGTIITQFRETDLSVGLAREIGRMTAVARIGLHALSIDQYGSTLLPLLDIALRVPISERITLGTTASNLTGTHLGNHAFPTILGAGLSVAPDSTLLLSIDAIAELDAPLSIRSGLTWNAIEAMTIRCGLGTGPARVGLGLELHLQRYDVALGSEFRAGLGLRHAIGGGLRW